MFSSHLVRPSRADASISPTSAAANIGHALIASANPSIQRISAEALRSLAITYEVCGSPEDFEERSTKNRYQVFLVDTELRDAIPLIRRLRIHPSTRTSVVIAFSGSKTYGSNEAFSSGAQFQVQGPLSRSSLDRVLRAAYGMIVRERRRYFRCPLEAEIVAHRRTESAWRGRLVNISEGGACLSAPVELSRGEMIYAEIRLPGSSIEICASCTVQWAAPNGRVGVQFQNLGAEVLSDLQHWLARQLERMYPTLSLRLH